MVRSKKSRKDFNNLPDGSFVQCRGRQERIYGFMVHEIVLGPFERKFALTSGRGRGPPPCSATYYMHVQTQLLFPLSIFADGWTAGDRSIILLFPRVQKYKAQTVAVQGNSAINLNRICCILFWYSHNIFPQMDILWGNKLPLRNSSVMAAY